MRNELRIKRTKNVFNKIVDIINTERRKRDRKINVKERKKDRKTNEKERNTKLNWIKERKAKKRKRKKDKKTDRQT